MDLELHDSKYKMEAMDHKYNLRWHDYHNSVLSTFRSLKEEEDFIDVTLSCEDQQYTAHKVVLSACSPYFRKLLKSNPCQHPIVILRDVREDDLRSLLNFMYHGEVQIDHDRLKGFLRTAETLQIKGLTDNPLKEQCQKTSSTSLTSTTGDGLILDQDEPDDYSPITKRPRHTNGPIDARITPPLSVRSPSPSNNNHDLPTRHLPEHAPSPWMRPGSPPQTEIRPDHGIHNDLGHKYENNKYGDNNNADKSLLSQALEKTPGREEREDSASDTTGSERPGSASMDTIKSDIATREGRDGELSGNPLFPPGLEALYRQAGFSPFLGLGGPHGQGHRDIPGHSQHVGLQSHAANPTVGGMLDSNMPSINQSINQLMNVSVGGMLDANMQSINVAGKLEMMRVRATDPRPCPKCGKIYRSAHTLRTHMEDKHTICPGYRCVLCGTVAKSRNSLHSHMSRQHRGISTKDLPVLPMPAPFDPDLASKLLSKAGVKVSASELAARASPTAPRRGDLPKLDSHFLNNSPMQQFPLPPSMPPSHLLHNHHRDSDPEDLRVPFTSGGGGPMTPASIAMAQAGIRPPNRGNNTGSALLDTYLTMIAAADGNVAAAAAALNFQNSPAGRAAAMAAAAAAASGGMMPPMLTLNGKEGSYDGRSVSERDDQEGELGSDADNDDMSDVEESGGGVTPGIVATNNGDHK